MLRRALILLAALALLALAALAGGAWWLLGTQQGLDWALARAGEASAGRLRVEAPRGTLGGGIEARSLSFADAGVKLDARGVATRVSALSLLFLRPEIARLEAREIDLVLPEGGGAAALPRSLALPLRLRVAGLRVGTLRVERGAQAFVLRDLRLIYGYGRRGHSVERLHLETEGVTLEGRAALGASPPFALSGALRLAGARAGVPFKAELELSGSLEKIAVRARGEAKGALVEASASLRPLAGLPPDKLDLELSKLDLRAFDAALPRTRLRVSAKLVRDGAALAGPVTVANALAGRIADGRVPVATLDGALRVDLEHAELSGLRAGLGDAGSVAGRLTLDRQGKLDAALDLSRIDLSRLAQLPASELTGQLTLSGSLSGEPRAKAQFSLGPSTLAGRALGGEGRLRLAGGRVEDGTLELKYSGAAIGVNGDIGPDRGHLRVRVQAQDLASLWPRLAGRATVEGEVFGGWRDPALRLRATGDELALNATGLRAERMQLTFDGKRSRHDIALEAQGKGFDLSARLRGALTAGDVWRATLVSARNRGTLPFELEHPAEISVARRRAELRGLAARFEQGRLSVRELRWENGGLASRGELDRVALLPLLRLAGVEAPLEGKLALGAEWSISAAPRLGGSFRLWREDGDLALGHEAPIELGLSALEVDGTLADGRLEAKGRFAARTGKGELALRLDPSAGAAGGVPWGADSRLAARLSAELASLAPFAALIDRSAQIDGRVGAQIEANGTLGHPELSGSIEGDAITYARPPDGIDLVDGELRARIANNVVELSRLSIASAAGGRFTAQGTLTRGEADRAAITWKAEKFALLDRPDQRLTVSGQGAAAMEHRRLSFSGALRADSGFFSFEAVALPKLGDDVVVAGREQAAPVERRIGRKQNPSPVDVDFELDLGSDLRIRGRGLDTGLAGKVHVRTDDKGVLIGQGTVRAVRGTVTAYGTRLGIERGRLIFDGPVNRPSLDILAMRRNQQVEAGVAVTGTLQNPTVRLVSEPPVPEGEALSWLVLGRAPGSASGADFGMLRTAAGALLGQESLGGPNAIAQRLGIDSISVGSRSTLGSEFVAVGKRINDRMSVIYEQGIGATASALRLDFDLSRHWALSATGGQQSDVGLRFRYSFD